MWAGGGIPHCYFCEPGLILLGFMDKYFPVQGK